MPPARRCRRVTVAATVAAVAAVGTAGAGIIPASVTVTPEAGNFRWQYSIVLPTDMKLQAGDYFTIYDFAGLVADREIRVAVHAVVDMPVEFVGKTGSETVQIREYKIAALHNRRRNRMEILFPLFAQVVEDVGKGSILHGCYQLSVIGYQGW